MKDGQTLLDVPRKYLNEKLVLSALVNRYGIKFRTWKVISNGNQIGVVTTASRPLKENGKILLKPGVNWKISCPKKIHWKKS